MPRWGKGGLSTASAVLVLLFFGLLALGLTLSYFGLSIYFEAQDVKNWPSTQGVVVDTYMRQGSIRGSILYYPEVQYQYSVDGVSYDGSDVAKNENGYDSYSDAQEYLDAHSIGTQVTVYYNPDAPGEAVLQKNFDISFMAVPLAGLVFTVVGVVGIYNFFRKKRS